jgi:hypothetical protein
MTKNKITGKYIFDNSGNTIAFLSIWDNKVCGKNIYSYSNSHLISHKNYSTWTPYKNNISESKWDSTKLSNEITFKYDGDNLIYYSDYVPEIENVFFEKSFTYSPEGKILVENIKTYYDSTTEKLETVHYAINDKKEYSYKDTITFIKYFRNNLLQATEEIISDKKGNVLQTILKSINGKLLNKYSYKYNDKSQLIEIRTIETGYNGFGDTFDVMPYEKTVLKYDNTGKIISKEQFYKGNLCDIDRYEYVK